MKLPYGLADFPTLIRDGFTYVDRTPYLRTLEDIGRALLFVRPRRFGKSLWLSTLATWWDLRFADDHERLFGHLAVGRGAKDGSTADGKTAQAHRYFVLRWNFSAIGTRGERGARSARELGKRLDEYLLGTLEAFQIRYADHLPRTVTIEQDPIRTLTKLLAVLEDTPYRLCLLIDEYDNFANEIMMTDEDAYQRLLHADGPFKQLMKWVKLAMEGQGLERLFLTGVTPVVLSDLTSGLNICDNVSQASSLNALCGFTEMEVRALLEQLLDDLGPGIDLEEALDMLRTWYNGYRFTSPETVPGGTVPAKVYNPTLALYFLNHLQREGRYPAQMLDTNLAADENKLRFFAHETEGGDLLAEMLQTGEFLEVEHIEDRFRVSEILAKARQRRSSMASFLYYFGMLTIDSVTPWRTLRLTPPNLVVRKIYVDEILNLLLANDHGHPDLLAPAHQLMLENKIEPLLSLIEQRLLPSFSRRDGRWMNELAIKTTFMALLFQDVNYRLLSEPVVRKAPASETDQEAGHGFADLVLLLRPDARKTGLHDLLFEFKYLKTETLGSDAARLAVLDRENLAELPPVAAALDAATAQARSYRDGLRERYGETLQLRTWVIVAIGFERLVARSLD